MSLSAYYKDVSSQPGWVSYNNDAGLGYLLSVTNFYQDHRGLEISLSKPHGRWLTGFLNYTYQVSTRGFFGKLEYHLNPSLQRTADEENNYQVKPIPRPFFRGNVALHTPSEWGPTILRSNPLGGWNAVFLAIWREGNYFTWTRGGVPGIQFNLQSPDYFNVDMRLSKNFHLGGQRFQFFLDVNNLFNTKIFTRFPFSEGNDYTAYLQSLLWPEEIGEPLGFTVFGNDRFGDLRPEDVPYDPLENLLLNPDNDPDIAAQNAEIETANSDRRKTKSYIDNPNLDYLYYLHPRDLRVGIRIDF